MELDVALFIYFGCTRHCHRCTETVSSCDLHMETCDHLLSMMMVWPRHKHLLSIPRGQKTHSYRSVTTSKPHLLSFQKYVGITEHQHILFSIARSHCDFGYECFLGGGLLTFCGYCCRLCVCLLTFSTFKFKCNNTNVWITGLFNSIARRIHNCTGKKMEKYTFFF